MRVLLSIKPEYALKIFEGSKRFEFRKVRFKQPNITTVVVYASSPVQEVIGEFDIDEIFSLSPNSLWKKTHSYSGISKEKFFDYFDGSETGHAIKIKTTRMYDTPLNLKKYFNVTPPQSYTYIE